MNGRATPHVRARLKLALVALLFLGPLALAAWLYYAGDSLQPSQRTNHGTILDPIVNLRDASSSPEWRAASRDHWVLVYSNDDVCGNTCRDALYTMRQERLMLGKDMGRLNRVFLHGESPPDTVFLADEHQGLVAIHDKALSRRLAERRPSELASGGFFLVDPLGNLVMYFPPDIVPGDMVDDIEHLLELSRIG